jgi:hypothetical protein
VWNWSENKELGKSILATAYKKAIAWPGKIHDNDAGDQYKDSFAKPGYRGCPTTFEDKDENIKNELIWKETYRRYNGGNRWAYWWWEPKDLEDREAGGKWYKRIYNPPKDPDDLRDNAGNYADDVWKIYKDGDY